MLKIIVTAVFVAILISAVVPGMTGLGLSVIALLVGIIFAYMYSSARTAE